jgi:hypothetical protein
MKILTALTALAFVVTSGLAASTPAEASPGVSAGTYCDYIGYFSGAADQTYTISISWCETTWSARAGIKYGATSSGSGVWTYGTWKNAGTSSATHNTGVTQDGKGFEGSTGTR